MRNSIGEYSIGETKRCAEWRRKVFRGAGVGGYSEGRRCTDR
jgi:hypothetical protein